MFSSSRVPRGSLQSAKYGGGHALPSTSSYLPSRVFRTSSIVLPSSSARVAASQLPACDAVSNVPRMFPSYFPMNVLASKSTPAYRPSSCFPLRSRAADGATTNSGGVGDVSLLRYTPNTRPFLTFAYDSGRTSYSICMSPPEKKHGRVVLDANRAPAEGGRRREARHDRRVRRHVVPLVAAAVAGVELGRRAASHRVVRPRRGGVPRADLVSAHRASRRSPRGGVPARRVGSNGARIFRPPTG